MDNTGKEKKYTALEVAEEIKKSLYKCLAKNLSEKKRAKTKDNIVADIKDPNYTAEVDPRKIPSAKTNVLWKKQPSKGLSQEESEKEFQVRRQREIAKKPPAIRRRINVNRQRKGLNRLRSFLQGKKRRKA